MREIDPQRMRTLFSKMSEALSQLNELAQLPVAEFLADFRNPASAKYLLIVATESAIDVCQHIVSKKGGRAPENYAQCFTLLAELGFISETLAQALRPMARFRNFLVHQYWLVDDQQIYEIIRHNLDDLETFRIEITHALLNAD